MYTEMESFYLKRGEIPRVLYRVDYEESDNL